jgi:hypothetical protein
MALGGGVGADLLGDELGDERLLLVLALEDGSRVPGRVADAMERSVVRVGIVGGRVLALRAGDLERCHRGRLERAIDRVGRWEGGAIGKVTTRLVPAGARAHLCSAARGGCQPQANRKSAAFRGARGWFRAGRAEPDRVRVTGRGGPRSAHARRISRARAQVGIIPRSADETRSRKHAVRARQLGSPLRAHDPSLRRALCPMIG